MSLGAVLFMFPKSNFYFTYETARFGSSKPRVKNLQEVFVFMQ
jgi:hypothetical protein